MVDPDPSASDPNLPPAKGSRVSRGPARFVILLVLASATACILVAALSGLGVPSCVGTADSRYGAAISAGRPLVRQIRSAYAAPGLAVAVMVEGKLVWSEGFGYADPERKTPVCPSTQFRIGDISMPLTSAAMAQLYENGRLALDAPISRYVTFPDKGDPITPRQLAGHLSGIRDYVGWEAQDATRYNTLRDALPRFSADPLLFRPGTRVAYSHNGYIVLGAVIEGAAGETYASYVQKHILEPIGLNHTLPDDAQHPSPDRAAVLEDTPRGVEPAPYVDYTGRLPAAGFISTPEDLVWFASALLNGRLVRRETVDLLLSPPCPECPAAAGRAAEYGLGWQIYHDATGRQYAIVDGRGVGSSALLWFYPEENVAVALAMNVGRTTHPDPQPHAVPVDPIWVAEPFLRLQPLAH